MICFAQIAWFISKYIRGHTEEKKHLNIYFPFLFCLFFSAASYIGFFFSSVSFPLCDGMYSVNRSNGMNNLLSASTPVNNSVFFQLLVSVSLVLREIYMLVCI